MRGRVKREKAPTVKITTRLPTNWRYSDGVVAQGNVGVGHGRLRAKVFVFRNPTALNRFWKRRLGKRLGRGCLGAVNGLRCSVSSFRPNKPERRRIEVDGRYFCVIGLCLGYLNMRIISHECVHAGFAYADRRTRAWWDKQARDFHEEEIAYPTGEIARNVVGFLQRKKLLPEER